MLWLILISPSPTSPDSTGGQARRKRCFTDSASRAALASAMTSNGGMTPGYPYIWVKLKSFWLANYVKNLGLHFEKWMFCSATCFRDGLIGIGTDWSKTMDLWWFGEKGWKRCSCEGCCSKFKSNGFPTKIEAFFGSWGVRILGTWDLQCCCEGSIPKPMNQGKMDGFMDMERWGWGPLNWTLRKIRVEDFIGSKPFGFRQMARPLESKPWESDGCFCVG